MGFISSLICAFLAPKSVLEFLMWPTISIVLTVVILHSLTVNGLWPIHLPNRPSPLVIRWHEVSSSDPHKILQHSRDLISGERVKPTNMTFYESRAFANEGLRQAFDLKNSFTTKVEAESRAFRTRAARILTNINRNLDEFMLRSHGALESGMEDFALDGPLGYQLTPLVRTTVYRILFCDLFKRECPDVQSSKQITDAINDAWLATKSSNPLASVKLDEARVQIEDCLMRQFPTFKKAIEHDLSMHPMNLIIPSYETMWRAVLIAFIELLRRRDPWRPHWAEKLAQFAHDPSQENFTLTADDGFSVENFVKEILRLYPPTKRIHRAVPSSPVTGSFVIEKADIKSLHRNKDIWGYDALRFNPARWTNTNSYAEFQDQREQLHRAYMPFGVHPYVCPALQVAPKVIAVFVGTLIKVLGVNWEINELRFEEQTGQEIPLLEDQRDSFERLEIYKDANWNPDSPTLSVGRAGTLWNRRQSDAKKKARFPGFTEQATEHEA